MKNPVSERPRRARAWSIVTAVAICLSGCVMGTQREGRPIVAKDVARVQIGKTTRQQVLDRFGPPSSLEAPGSFRTSDRIGDPPVSRARTDQDVYIYNYWEDHEKFFSFVLLYTWYRRVRLTDTLLVGFDAAGIVQNVAFSRQTESGE